MALSGKSNFCIPSWLHRHTARQRFPSPSVGICRAVWLFMGYSALFIEPPSAGFAIMLGGLLAYSRIILSKCCVIRPFSMPFGYFFSTIWLFFSIISLRFPPKTAACAGLSYTFPFILHAILHPKIPIIANDFLAVV